MLKLKGISSNGIRRIAQNIDEYFANLPPATPEELAADQSYRDDMSESAAQRDVQFYEFEPDAPLDDVVGKAYASIIEVVAQYTEFIEDVDPLLDADGRTFSTSEFITELANMISQHLAKDFG